MIDEEALAESNTLNNQYNFQALLSDVRRYIHHGKIQWMIERIDYYFAPAEIPEDTLAALENSSTEIRKDAA